MTGTPTSVRTHILKTNQNSIMSAYLSGNQSSLTGNSWNKINLNSVLYDVGLNFDTSAKRFNAPVTGLYRIHGVVHFTSVITTERYMTAIYVNNAAIKYAYQHASKASDLSVSIDTEVFLNQNDYVELYAQPEVGGGVNTVAAIGGNLYTGLEVRLITKEGIKQ